MVSTHFDPYWLQGKKTNKYKKEDGVEFKMMFRHHKDPLFFDSKANAKIFVPVDPMSALDDK